MTQALYRAPQQGPQHRGPSRHELHPLQIQKLHLSKVRAQRCKASTLQLGVLGECSNFTMGKMGQMAQTMEKNMENSWDMNLAGRKMNKCLEFLPTRQFLITGIITFSVDPP